MPYEIAVPVLAGVLFLMNVVLTLGVVRRLRAHTARIDQMYDVVAGSPEPAAPDPAPVPPTNELLPEGGVVVFLSPGCHAELAEVTAWAAGQDPSRVVAVVDARSEDATEMISALSPLAQVVVQRDSAQVSERFGVRSAPAALHVGADGTVLARADSVTGLPGGVPRAAGNPS